MPSLTTDIPLNDLRRLVDDESSATMNAAIRTLRSGWWLNGVEVDGFCRAFARYLGVNQCLGVANGTDALEIAMRALVDSGRAVGSQVVMVANAGGYAAIASFSAGLTPVYADIERQSQLLDVSSIVSTLGPETAIVVATHLYGGVVDIPALRTTLKEAGYGHVPILEDCAQAHGARLADSTAGSMGDVATFSFYPTKNLGASGDGGAIASSDEMILERCRALRQYGWKEKYQIDVAHGRNSRLDEIQAAILSERLVKLDAQNKRRVEILDSYRAAAPSNILVVRASWTVAHLAVVMTDNREGLALHLRGRNIHSDIHYPVLDVDQVGWRNLIPQYSPDALPVSRACVSKILTIPCFPQMTTSEVDRVCEALMSWGS